MFRTVAHPARSLSFTVKHRNFVSTILLSRTWESETLVTLRQEAKNRGLSTKGNKSIIINRIQEYEEYRAIPSSQFVKSETPAASRNASSSAIAPQTASPGIPPASQPASASVTPGFLAIKLPDLSQDGPRPHVQPPFVPDFWDSSNLFKPEPREHSLPKLHVVSGSVTHPDGGPTHNLEKPHEADGVEKPTSAVHAVPTGEPSFLRGLADDLGLPRTLHVGNVVSNTVHAVKERGSDVHANSRPLNNEEVRGVWVLVGLFAGSWIVGEWVNRAPPVLEEHRIAEDKE